MGYGLVMTLLLWFEWEYSSIDIVTLTNIVEGSIFPYKFNKFPLDFLADVNLALVETLLKPMSKLHSHTSKDKIESPLW